MKTLMLREQNALDVTPLESGVVQRQAETPSFVVCAMNGEACWCWRGPRPPTP